MFYGIVDALNLEVDLNLMARLAILEFPDPRLRTVAKPVAAVDARIQRIITDMLETMYDAEGLGLAASQVDIHEQIVVIDISETRDQAMVFINPDIEVLDDTLFEFAEACLSVPGFSGEISRPKRIRVKALDRRGDPFTIEPEGLLSVCIQHEVDHLKGKLYVDYMSGLKRQRIRKKLEKEQKSRA